MLECIEAGHDIEGRIGEGKLLHVSQVERSHWNAAPGDFERFERCIKPFHCSAALHGKLARYPGPTPDVEQMHPCGEPEAIKGGVIQRAVPLFPPRPFVSVLPPVGSVRSAGSRVS